MNSMDVDVVMTGRKFMVAEKDLVTDQAGGVRQSRVEVRRLPHPTRLRARRVGSRRRRRQGRCDWWWFLLRWKVL